MGSNIKIDVYDKLLKRISSKDNGKDLDTLKREELEACLFCFSKRLSRLRLEHSKLIGLGKDVLTDYGRGNKRYDTSKMPGVMVDKMAK